MAEHAVARILFGHRGRNRPIGQAAVSVGTEAADRAPMAVVGASVATAVVATGIVRTEAHPEKIFGIHRRRRARACHR